MGVGVRPEDNRPAITEIREELATAVDRLHGEVERLRDVLEALEVLQDEEEGP